MKCPLLHIKLTVNKTAYEGEPQDCLKEECAWWDSEAKWCRCNSIEVDLHLISAYLNTIKDKMPHKGQFRDR